MNLKNLHSEIEYIAKSSLYKWGANGDNRLMAALCLIMNLSHQLDYGNYALRGVSKVSENCSMDTTSKECVQLLYIQQAFQHYSACFDTILQIVYFGFHIAKDFSSHKKYLATLKGANFENITKKLGDRPNDDHCKYMLKVIRIYYNTGRSVINDAVNSAKHRGGISVPSLNTYIPPIANCQGVTYKNNGGPEFTVSKDYAVIKADWFYPYTATIGEYMHALELANKRIKKFIDAILNCMNISPDTINKSDFKLPFYYDNYGTEQTK